MGCHLDMMWHLGGCTSCNWQMIVKVRRNEGEALPLTPSYHSLQRNLRSHLHPIDAIM